MDFQSHDVVVSQNIVYNAAVGIDGASIIAINIISDLATAIRIGFGATNERPAADRLAKAD